MKTVFSFFVAILMSTGAFAMTNDEAMVEAQKTIDNLTSTYEALANQVSEAATSYPEVAAEYSARMEALAESIAKVTSYATTQYAANNLQYSLEGFNETAAGVASEIVEVKGLFEASVASVATSLHRGRVSNIGRGSYTLSGAVAPKSYKGLTVHNGRLVLRK